jgi:hypothetical protein
MDISINKHMVPNVVAVSDTGLLLQSHRVHDPLHPVFLGRGFFFLLLTPFNAMNTRHTDGLNPKLSFWYFHDH